MAYSYSRLNILYTITKPYNSLGRFRIEFPPFPGYPDFSYRYGISSFVSYSPTIFTVTHKSYGNDYFEFIGNSSQLVPGQLLNLTTYNIRNPPYPINLTNINVTLFDMEGYAL